MGEGKKWGRGSGGGEALLPQPPGGSALQTPGKEQLNRQWQQPHPFQKAMLLRAQPSWVSVDMALRPSVRTVAAFPDPPPLSQKPMKPRQRHPSI